MEQIKLEDLVPEGATFALKKTGKTYRLRPVSLSDELWMNRTFGAEIESVFRQIKMKEICRIVFHQLEEEDKVDFLAQDVTIINEEGEKITQRIGGAELLFILISGYAEKISIFQALLATIGVSRPMLDKLEQDITSTEKKTVEGATGLTGS
jgi:hypothetical protein